MFDKRALMIPLAMIAVAACNGNGNEPVITEAVSYNGINFGTDHGKWSSDNECDDPRFKGTGMTSTPLLPEDVMRDASDCLLHFKAGSIEYIGSGA